MRQQSYYIVLFFIIFILQASCFAQSVSIIQKNKSIIFTYNAESTISNFEIWYSLNSESWRPIKNASGDIGSNISMGSNKKVVWDVLSEYDEFIHEGVHFKYSFRYPSRSRTYQTDGVLIWDKDKGVGNYFSGHSFNIFSYKKKIKEYVESRINTWQQKGTFEKTSDYQARVNESSRKKKIAELQAEIIAEFAAKEEIVLLSNDYDADNEVFKISIEDKNPVYVPVPLSEAESFDSNFKEIKVEQPRFVLTDDDEFIIQSAQFINPANGKRYAYYAQNVLVYNVADSNLKFNDVVIALPSKKATSVTEQIVQVNIGKSDVDVNLPKTSMSKPNAIAVVIGNAAYTRAKKVPYALADAQVIKKYLVEVMGFKEGNIIYRENANKSDFEEIFGNEQSERGRLANAIKPNQSDVFVFYSGHGAPGLNTKQGYFVPITSDPQYIEQSGYSAEVFYRNLAKMQARHTTVVLDACFSGAELIDGVSPIIVQSKGVKDIQNGALLASSSSDQASAWYPEKQHGLFTYFFLKGIHSKVADKNKDRNITIKEMYDYVADRTKGVPYYARRLRNLDQIPSLDGEGFDYILVNY